MGIDYVRMQKVFPKQKAALTRAVKSGDRDKLKATCAATVREWDAIGAWPDDWSRWQRALTDAGLYIELSELRSYAPKPDARIRARRVADIIERHGEPEGDNDFEPESDNRFLMVEESSHYRGRIWYTWHDSPEGAAQHRLSDECMSDWDTVALYDVHTGERFAERLAITWDKES